MNFDHEFGQFSKIYQLRHSSSSNLSKSPQVECIVVVPGNGGTEQTDKVFNKRTVREDDYSGLVNLARGMIISLVVPDPGVSIEDGIDGYFREGTLLIFLAFFSRKKLLKSRVQLYFLKNSWLGTMFPPLGVGVSETTSLPNPSLASGKGVIFAKSEAGMLKALKDVTLDRIFAEAGLQVFIEEYLEGDELSILKFSDGVSFVSLPPAQGYTLIRDEETSPYT
ncbi:phosphoribosylglycinamide synthetase [Bisporella sp. PMI_857]|nr:phosphoribosylglycinamide synthetase [Bisporella sp. PMI_857]